MDLGLDLVDVDEVSESIRMHGERYLRRVYTERERREACADARRLAARFAAKEATMKALGRGAEQPLPWRAIETRSAGGGQLTLGLAGAAAELARTRGVTSLALTVAHERRVAAAVVLAERTEVG